MHNYQDHAEVSPDRPCALTVRGREVWGRVEQVSRLDDGRLASFVVRAGWAEGGKCVSHYCRFVASDVEAGRVKIAPVASGWMSDHVVMELEKLYRMEGENHAAE